MKIINAKITNYPIKLTTPFKYALATLDFLPYVMITIETDTGIIGHGESAIGWDTTGEMPAGSIQIFNEIALPYLQNRTIDSVESVQAVMNDLNKFIYENTGLKSGVEFALLDVLTQSQNIPVWHLFATHTNHDTITPQIVFSLTASTDPVTIVDKIKNAQQGGVKYFKFKADKNIEQLATILNLVGQALPTAQFILDANQSWEDAEASLSNLARLENLNIAWIEQPVHHDNYGALAAIRQSTKFKIMADESCHNLRDLENLYARQAIDMINIKLAKCGGLMPALAMAKFCETNNIQYVLGSMFNSNLGTASDLHFAALTNCVSYDITPPSMITEDIFAGISFQDYRVAIPTAAGLGVSLKK